MGDRYYVNLLTIHDIFRSKAVHLMFETGHLLNNYLTFRVDKTAASKYSLETLFTSSIFVSYPILT